MATVDAGRVYRLLGAKDIGVTEDYHTAKMPDVNVGLLDGELAWRQHDGGHTDAPNMKYFIEWAESSFAASPRRKLYSSPTDVWPGTKSPEPRPKAQLRR